MGGTAPAAAPPASFLAPRHAAQWLARHTRCTKDRSGTSAAAMARSRADSRAAALAKRLGEFASRWPRARPLQSFAHPLHFCGQLLGQGRQRAGGCRRSRVNDKVARRPRLRQPSQQLPRPPAQTIAHCRVPQLLRHRDPEPIPRPCRSCCPQPAEDGEVGGAATHAAIVDRQEVHAAKQAARARPASTAGAEIFASRGTRR